MNLLNIVHRPAPQPWLDGEKIPWHEPAFSQRMLAEHLSQAHDAASRRFSVIDQHVAWIHDHVLGGAPAHILDLGCGPGLYLNRLARLGHKGVGIDFSPASVAHARAEAGDLPVAYRLADLRTAPFESGDTTAQLYDLAMLLYGEFNTFRLDDAHAILARARAVLRPGGRLLLEPSTFDSIQALGEAPPSWYATAGGLWSDRPHIVLQDNAWDAEQRAAIERYVIIDAATGALTPHAMTTQALTEDELRALLHAAGFAGVTTYPSLLGRPDSDHAGFYAVLAHTPG
jgi:SAM-dependent methyltransferase